MLRLVLLLFAGFIISLLSACGQTGPLYLPKKSAAPAHALSTATPAQTVSTSASGDSGDQPN